MEFPRWLLAEIESRGWNKSELARRAGLNDSTVSMVMSGKRNPGFDFCVGVANALEVRPETVLRQAGLLPSEPPEVAEETGLLVVFRGLPQRLRQVVVEMVNSLARAQRAGDLGLAEDRVAYETYEPRTFTERVAIGLARDLERLSEDDQRRVYDLMRRLRGDDRAESGESKPLPVDTDP